MINLGVSTTTGEDINLTKDERRQGTYIIGTTGTGKSTLLKRMIFQDMHPEKKQGLCLLDPHGDLTDEILGLVPKDRMSDVILFDPTNENRPFGLNLLACDRTNPTEVRWVVSTVISTLRRLYSYSWGPRLQHVLSNALETVMRIENSTFLELYFLLSNKDYRAKAVSKLDDPILQEFWDSFPTNSARLEYELTASTLNKISPFITDSMMRNIICQTENTIDIFDIMDKGQILLVNLSKGDLGEENSSLLGSILVNLVLIAALKRRKKKEDERTQFHLYVDEFQNFANDSFPILQSEARKYAIDLVVAHQYRDQLDDLNKGSTFNVGNLISFRTTGPDGYDLARQYDNTPPPPETVMEPQYHLYKETSDGRKIYTQPRSATGVGALYEPQERIRRTYSDVQAEKANTLSTLANYQAYCRLIYDPQSRGEEGVPTLVQHQIRTKQIEIKRPLEKQEEIRDQIKEKSNRQGTPRYLIEREIKKRSFGLFGDNNQNDSNVYEKRTK